MGNTGMEVFILQGGCTKHMPVAEEIKKLDTVSLLASAHVELCKSINNRLHTTCGGSQKELQRGIHFNFSSEFYTAQYTAEIASL